MNRYTRSGVIDDVCAGRRVVVVADTAMLAHAALRDVEADLPAGEVGRTFRANGRERIEMRSGGWVRFATAGSPSSLRGVECDVVYCDSHDAAVRVREHLSLMIASSPHGEVIHP